MENKLRAYMDHLFQDVPNTKKAVEVKEEILQNIVDKYHDLVTEMLETAIRRVGNEYADMLFEYEQQRREAEKQCEQLAMEGMVKK